jgi:hypothetical protein
MSTSTISSYYYYVLQSDSLFSTFPYRIHPCRPRNSPSSPSTEYIPVALAILPCQLPIFLRDDMYAALDFALIICGLTGWMALVPQRLIYVQLLRIGRLVI